MSVDAKNYSLKAGVFKESYAKKTMKAGSSMNENFGGSASYTMAGSLKLQGSSVFFKADSKITIKGAGATVTITDGEIKIDAATKTSGAGISTDKEENG